MRQILTHAINPANEQLLLRVIDEPGSGGAHHHYEIALDNIDDPKRDGNPGQPRTLATLHFQNGPIKEAGVNGITHEVLLAVLIDRLQCFQKGPYASRFNALALTKLEEAQMWLLQRTRERMARGVEGTHAV